VSVIGPKPSAQAAKMTKAQKRAKPQKRTEVQTQNQAVERRTCILDTSVLVAALNAEDKHHELCLESLTRLYKHKVQIILPAVCLSEADNILGKVPGGTDLLLAFVENTCTVEDIGQDLARVPGGMCCRVECVG
jgi:hypothetical protein